MAGVIGVASTVATAAPLVGLEWDDAPAPPVIAAGEPPVVELVPLAVPEPSLVAEPPPQPLRVRHQHERDDSPCPHGGTHPGKDYGWGVKRA